ncbi:unnamed protein product [Cunninghamella blakesleeana]
MSVFEGFIVLKITEPISVKRLKIIFKASERLNFDVLGWQKNKEDDGRLFAIRTTLFNQEVSGDILEAGSHTFRFAIELPPVNYPPTIDHYLIGTTFSLVGSLERNNDNTPYRTAPYPVLFRPVLQTRLLKLIPTSPLLEHEAIVTQRVLARLILPSLEYNIFDTKHIPIQIILSANHPQYFINANLQQVKIALKQQLTIHHKSFTRSETISLYQTDLRIPFNSVQNAIASPSSSTDCSCSVTLQSDIPLKNNPLPTVNFSTRFKLNYILDVSIKYRQGPLATKKKLFNLPIHFGTLPPGALPDNDLLLYTDDQVKNCTTLAFKPKFLTPINHPDELLPAYDELYRPPTYQSRITSTPDTATNNNLIIANNGRSILI